MLSTARPVWRLVLAAGSGTRFGSEKQLVTIAGPAPVDVAAAFLLHHAFYDHAGPAPTTLPVATRITPEHDDWCAR